MANYTNHKAGTFCWIELATTDAEAAKRFYGGLFGWTFDDLPMGPSMTYTMAKLGDKQVGALYKMGADMAGMPPNWAAYVAVDDVDAMTKKVVANGGKAIKEAFDVMDVGRMSVIEDPTGAMLCLWQAKAHAGVGVKEDPGSLCWNEIFTTNVDAAGKFYANTFGWKPQGHDMGEMGTYTLFKVDGVKDSVGGMMGMPPNMKGVPSHWLSYIAVTDCDASAKKAADLGAKIIQPPTDIPDIGRFAVLQDPTGATIAIYKNAH